MLRMPPRPPRPQARPVDKSRCRLERAREPPRVHNEHTMHPNETSAPLCIYNVMPTQLYYCFSNPDSCPNFANAFSLIKLPYLSMTRDSLTWRSCLPS